MIRPKELSQKKSQYDREIKHIQKLKKPRPDYISLNITQ